MKRDLLKRNKLCFFCFSGRHSIAFCPKLKKEKGCSFCDLKSHSKALCYRFDQNNSDKTTSHSHKEESDDSITSVSSCQTETKSQRVLLQTASVVARYNKQFRNCCLLADTAAQRSFVERKFSRLLKQYQTTLLKHFWNKWKTQYLLDLKTVHHFKSPNIHKDVEIGDVVLDEGFSKSKLLWEQFKKLLWVEVDTSEPVSSKPRRNFSGNQCN
ncbi:integrase catalytic domain-containing protein [Trichonephila clavipes]|uniref:Integrase catalytic domain-containing protein n=1 Tax=Trichonephila clavipes TaxID=2585209 RepID=A0A8X6RX32_TRICX|nr:integrase catalytic domain-containing protein [Trichonephila clavipes]